MADPQRVGDMCVFGRVDDEAAEEGVQIVEQPHGFGFRPLCLVEMLAKAFRTFVAQRSLASFGISQPPRCRHGCAAV